MIKRATFLLLVSVIMLAALPLSMTVSAQNPDCEGDVTLTYWHHWGGNQGNRIKLVEADGARNRYPSLRGSVFAVNCFCLYHA